MSEPSQAFLNDRFEDLGNTVRNRKTGRVIGASTVNGYPCVRVGPISEPRMLLHRALWVMRNGPIPDGKIVDHEDGNPFNRIGGNLRLATLSNNQWNRKKNRNCKLHPGVRKIGARYYVSINANKITHSAGGFSVYEHACAASDALRAKLHGEFRRIEV